MRRARSAAWAWRSGSSCSTAAGPLALVVGTVPFLCVSASMALVACGHRASAPGHRPPAGPPTSAPVMLPAASATQLNVTRLRTGERVGEAVRGIVVEVERKKLRGVGSEGQPSPTG